MNSIDLVREFHARFKQRNCDAPSIDSPIVNDLRIALLTEEVDELHDALRAGDPVAVLDALTDIQYVLDGSYLSLGFAHLKDAALAEVHRSNMSKLGADGEPVYLPGGKVTKGPNYRPPNLERIVRRDRERREQQAACSHAWENINEARPAFQHCIRCDSFRAMPKDTTTRPSPSRGRGSR